MLPQGYKATAGFMGVDCWVEKGISGAREVFLMALPRKRLPCKNSAMAMLSLMDERVSGLHPCRFTPYKNQTIQPEDTRNLDFTCLPSTDSLVI